MREGGAEYRMQDPEVGRAEHTQVFRFSQVRENTQGRSFQREGYRIQREGNEMAESKNT